MSETKLKEEIHPSFKEEGYNNWKRDRKGKGGGGIMFMVREHIYVEEVQYGDGTAEIMELGEEAEDYINICPTKD